MNDQDMKICEYECDECQESTCNCNCRCICEPPKKYLKPNRTMLKCGCPGSVTLPLATIAGATFTLATVNVDTRSLRNPCIKFEFASNVVTTAAVITLNFQIFKQCKGQLTPIPVGPIWTFARLVAVTDSNTFSFFVCDCDVCGDDCCTYSVVATVAGVATVGVTSVTNATLSAIVVDNDCF
ncbi:DUF4489 domain-containing protein [Lachnospiraceae bacterium 54-53]